MVRLAIEEAASSSEAWHKVQCQATHTNNRNSNHLSPSPNDLSDLSNYSVSLSPCGVTGPTGSYQKRHG